MCKNQAVGDGHCFRQDGPGLGILATTSKHEGEQHEDGGHVGAAAFACLELRIGQRFVKQWLCVVTAVLRHALSC